MAETSRHDSGSTAARRKTRGKAPAGEGIRDHRYTVWVSTHEKALITVAAATDGMKEGAWVGRAAVDAAKRAAGGETPDRTSITELVEALRDRRRLLAMMGSNVNQFAAGYNATGVVENPNAVSATLDFIREQVLEIDDVVDRLKAKWLR